MFTARMRRDVLYGGSAPHPRACIVSAGASRARHSHLIVRMKNLGFEQRLADACVLRLIEDGAASIVAILVFILVVNVRYHCMMFLRRGVRIGRNRSLRS